MEKDLSLSNNPTIDDDYLFSASCQDCTGLIPTGMHSDWELENYEELYRYLPPTAKIEDSTYHFPGESEQPSL